jgi:hypothetical protein
MLSQNQTQQAHLYSFGAQIIVFLGSYQYSGSEFRYTSI